MLKVSIALTTYNGEKYIEKQLASLTTQHRLPDEVVIVDDNSSDITASIVKDYIEKNALPWKFVQNEENLGFKENFRKALSLTTGDVCFLCDQDDVWCDDKIETGISLFSDDKIMGISTGFTVIDGLDNDITEEVLQKNTFAFTNEKFIKPLNKIPLEAIMHRNISPGCTCAYRRKAIDIFLENYDPSLPHDYQLNAISSALSGFVFYNVPLTFYRLHSSNTLGINPLEQSREEIAEEKLALSGVLANINPKCAALNQMCKKRYRAVKDRNVFGILSLFFSPEYRKYYSFKERTGDILYTLRR